jgi:hypothetical protein
MPGRSLATSVDREINLALDKQIIHLQRSRNSLSNVARLPPETLGHIFRLNVKPKTDDDRFAGLGKCLHSLLRVCHRWFEVARCTPEFWTFWGNSLEEWKQQHPRSGPSPLGLALDGVTEMCCSTMPAGCIQGLCGTGRYPESSSQGRRLNHIASFLSYTDWSHLQGWTTRDRSSATARRMELKKLSCNASGITFTMIQGSRISWGFSSRPPAIVSCFGLASFVLGIAVRIDNHLICCGHGKVGFEIDDALLGKEHEDVDARLLSFVWSLQCHEPCMRGALLR